VSIVQASPSAQTSVSQGLLQPGIAVKMQVPFAHESIVQMLPSLQTIGVKRHVPFMHESVVQRSLSSQRIEVNTQMPFKQESVVHKSPSLQMTAV